MLALPFSPPRPLPLHPSQFLTNQRSNTIRACSMDRDSRITSLFPPLLHRHLALQLASLIDSRLGSLLLPSSVPDNIKSFQNQSGTSIGSIDIRYGSPDSSIDFILESWLHCKVPNGTIDITSLLAFQNDRTDAPHFQLEFIQGNPTSLILILDLLPRKDLSMDPNYTEKYYELTGLDKQRQEIEKLPQSVPYMLSSLYTRSVLSPTAIIVSISGVDQMDEMMNGTVKSVAKEVLQIWLDQCVGTGTEMGEEEREYIVRRDKIVKSKMIEIDLQTNLPRLFDQDISNRVIMEIQKAFEQSREI